MKKYMGAGQQLIALLGVFVFSISTALAQRPTGIPQLESRPGAEFTIFLNPGGFDYTGDWEGFAESPGFTPALGDVPQGGSFDASQQKEITTIWAEMASVYAPFNVNVTTIDPYDAVNDPTPTDFERQTFYDQTPRMMHTVLGSALRAGTANPNGTWHGLDADGLSGLNVVSPVAANNGDHTNWMFTEAQQGVGFINGSYIGSVASHENGHAFGLDHQGDYNGSTQVAEYSSGDQNPGNGSYVPIMGNASDRQRTAWRVGDVNKTTDPMGQTVVNDVQSMLALNGSLQFVDDGIGNSLSTATPLAIVGGSIDVTSSTGKGVIVPLSSTDPDPLGASNYTENWHSFYTDGIGAINLTLHNGLDLLTAGVEDLSGIDLQAGTLRSTLSIFDSVGTLVGMGVEDATTLFSQYNDTLASGTYYAVVNSFGGHQQDSPSFNPAEYFDMGAYFLTGSGFDVVPEPSSFVLLAFASVTIAVRRRG